MAMSQAEYEKWQADLAEMHATYEAMDQEEHPQYMDELDARDADPPNPGTNDHGCSHPEPHGVGAAVAARTAADRSTTAPGVRPGAVSAGRPDVASAEHDQISRPEEPPDWAGPIPVPGRPLHPSRTRSPTAARGVGGHPAVQAATALLPGPYVIPHLNEEEGPSHGRIIRVPAPAAVSFR